MKLRTEISLKPLANPLRLEQPTLALGSCFAEHIAGRLRAVKAPVVINPLGVLFNPLSIARTLWRLERGERIELKALRERSGLWFHHDLHGSFSGEEPQKVLEQMNRAIEEGSEALKRAETLLLTFGTARVYEREGVVVANCHKEPRDCFRERMLSVEEIVQAWSPLLEGPLAGKRIILTLSPVRHLSDGAEENSLSKALLRVAIAALRERFGGIEYFPAYELMMDDLRDYRFYREDLLHPSTLAIDYLWERFLGWAFTEETGRQVERIEEVMRACQHRPLHPHSEAYRTFCRGQLVRLETLERECGLDFREERAFFAQSVE